MGLVLPTIKATLLKSICHWVQKSEKKHVGRHIASSTAEKPEWQILKP